MYTFQKIERKIKIMVEGLEANGENFVDGQFITMQHMWTQNHNRVSVPTTHQCHKQCGQK